MGSGGSTRMSGMHTPGHTAKILDLREREEKGRERTRGERDRRIHPLQLIPGSATVNGVCW